MTINMESSGSFDDLESWIKRAKQAAIFQALTKYGDMGVAALSAATPTESGETSESWYYEIEQERNQWSIIWGNSHVEDGRPIAVLLQYGHGTGSGGYVAPNDYINPALKPIFDAAVAEGWKVVMA